MKIESLVNLLSLPLDERKEIDFKQIINIFEEKMILKSFKEQKVQELDPDSINECFAKNMEIRFLKAHEDLFFIDDYADKFYLILKGSVNVHIPVMRIKEMTNYEYYKMLEMLFFDKEINLIKIIINENIIKAINPTEEQLLSLKNFLNENSSKNDIIYHNNKNTPNPLEENDIANNSNTDKIDNDSDHLNEKNTKILHYYRFRKSIIEQEKIERRQSENKNYIINHRSHKSNNIENRNVAIDSKEKIILFDINRKLTLKFDQLETINKNALLFKNVNNIDKNNIPHVSERTQRLQTLSKTQVLKIFKINEFVCFEDFKKYMQIKYKYQMLEKIAKIKNQADLVYFYETEIENIKRILDIQIKFEEINFFVKDDPHISSDKKSGIYNRNMNRKSKRIINKNLKLDSNFKSELKEKESYFYSHNRNNRNSFADISYNSNASTYTNVMIKNFISEHVNNDVKNANTNNDSENYNLILIDEDEEKDDCNFILKFNKKYDYRN